MVLLLGILLVVLGLFGVVWFAFMISRKIQNVYGVSDGWTARKVVRDDGMRWLRAAMRASAGVAAVGVMVAIASLL